MRTMKAFILTLLAAVLVFAAGYRDIAQLTTGSILLSVLDASGTVVSGATVTITDTGKGHPSGW